MSQEAGVEKWAGIERLGRRKSQDKDWLYILYSQGHCWRQGDQFPRDLWDVSRIGCGSQLVGIYPQAPLPRCLRAAPEGATSAWRMPWGRKWKDSQFLLEMGCSQLKSQLSRTFHGAADETRGRLRKCVTNSGVCGTKSM